MSMRVSFNEKLFRIFALIALVEPEPTTQPENGSSRRALRRLPARGDTLGSVTSWRCSALSQGKLWRSLLTLSGARFGSRSLGHRCAAGSIQTMSVQHRFARFTEQVRHAAQTHNSEKQLHPGKRLHLVKRKRRAGACARGGSDCARKQADYCVLVLEPVRLLTVVFQAWLIQEPEFSRGCSPFELRSV